MDGAVAGVCAAHMDGSTNAISKHKRNRFLDGEDIEFSI
jgi:hypothetical protein